MITLTHKGKDYEVVEYRQLQDGDYFVSIFNDILHVEAGEGSGGRGERLVVRPVPVEHTFGKVVYVEGERHIPREGEWYVSRGTVKPTPLYAYKNLLAGDRTILRPVRIITDE